MYYIIKLRCVDSEGEECDRYIGENFWTVDNLEDAEKFGRYTTFSNQDFRAYIKNYREVINHHLKACGCEVKNFILTKVSFIEQVIIE